MKGKESDQGYYIEGSFPVPQEEVAGEHMDIQMHQGGYQGGNAGMIHQGVAGEYMGGQIHQEGYQASSLGSSFGHQHGQASHLAPRRNQSEPKQLMEEKAQKIKKLEQKSTKGSPPVLTKEEQRKVRDIILRNLSSFPKCKYCLGRLRTCDQTKAKCTSVSGTTKCATLSPLSTWVRRRTSKRQCKYALTTVGFLEI
jgi:hypothetical protein